MKNTISAVAALSIVLTAALHEANAQAEMKSARRHYQLVDKQARLAYEITVVTDFSNAEVRTVMLIRDEAFGDFIFEHGMSFEKHTFMAAISDAKRKVYVRLHYDTPMTGKTRQEAMAELDRSPQVFQASVIYVLETNGGEWEGGEAQWKTPTELRQLRTEVRRSMDPTLLEALERMRGSLFLTSDGESIRSTFARYLLHGATEGGEPELSQANVRPDCDFDKSFGMPCTEKQLARIKKAQGEKRELIAY